jgi:uncharacterized membrane protein
MVMNVVHAKPPTNGAGDGPQSAIPAVPECGTQSTALAWLGGIGVGVALTKLLDGRWRRRHLSQLRDQTVHARRMAWRAAGRAAEDARNRTQGLMAELKARAGRSVVDDATLEARVRAKLGRISSHPHAIETWAHGGTITLRGPVLADEVERVVRAVASVPGVKGVVNELDVYDEPGHIPGLQGQPAPQEGEFELLQENWSPAVRLGAAAVGGMMGLYGAGRRGVVGRLAMAAGLGLLIRALTNAPFRRLTGIGAGRRAVDITKDITINAPPERVYEVVSQVQALPRFLAHVRAVQITGAGRSRWTVDGPAGLPVRWEAEVTRLRPHESITWQTIGRPLVAHTGTIRLDRNPDGGTRFGIKMSYNPLVGWLGHVLVTVLGANPKRFIDEDLVRLKSLLEQGKTTAHGEEVTIEEIEEAVPVHA